MGGLLLCKSELFDQLYECGVGLPRPLSHLRARLRYVLLGCELLVRRCIIANLLAVVLSVCGLSLISAVADKPGGLCSKALCRICLGRVWVDAAIRMLSLSGRCGPCMFLVHRRGIGDPVACRVSCCSEVSTGFSSCLTSCFFASSAVKASGVACLSYQFQPGQVLV